MNRLIQKLHGKTVAIVGNGNVIEDHSTEIDSADVVIRFNHFYNYDSNKVGKRVDIVMQTITPAWEQAIDKHIDVLDKYRPEVFLVRSDFQYTTNIHKWYGNAIRVNNTTRWFDYERRFTTGTTVLQYLAQTLTNASVKCYGFQDEADWKRYVSTDAKSFGHTDERKVMLDSIAKLESLTITNQSTDKELPNIVLIPIKRTSSGCPNKNRILIRRCLKEVLKTKLRTVIVGDDYDLMHDLHEEFGVETSPLPMIGNLADVTDTIRDWKVKSGFSGDIALVQCTSPKLKSEWITDCLNHSKHSALVVTATELTFKPNAIYYASDNVYIPMANQLPPASVARQLLPRAVRITGAVEVFHTDALDHKSFYQDGVMYPVIVSEEDSLDVDTEKDLAKAMSLI